VSEPALTNRATIGGRRCSCQNPRSLIGAKATCITELDIDALREHRSSGEALSW
jgi:hypothetical protein